jgi:hypothetical protein
MPINEHYHFLNRLRESGVTNMWGSPAYLAVAYDISKPAASKIVAAWMKWVQEDPSNRDL